MSGCLLSIPNDAYQGTVSYSLTRTFHIARLSGRRWLWASRLIKYVHQSWLQSDSEISGIPEITTRLEPKDLVQLSVFRISSINYFIFEFNLVILSDMLFVQGPICHDTSLWQTSHRAHVGSYSHLWNVYISLLIYAYNIKYMWCSEF